MWQKRKKYIYNERNTNISRINQDSPIKEIFLCDINEPAEYWEAGVNVVSLRHETGFLFHMFIVALIRKKCNPISETVSLLNCHYLNLYLIYIISIYIISDFYYIWIYVYSYILIDVLYKCTVFFNCIFFKLGEQKLLWLTYLFFFDSLHYWKLLRLINICWSIIRTINYLCIRLIHII